MDKNKALSKAMNICSKQEKCKNDILKKLEQWQVYPNDYDFIIEALEKEKFIDEDRYTRFYVNDKFVFNKWGKIKIAYNLKLKNIDTSIVEKYLNEIDNEKYLESVKELLLAKKKKVKANSEYELKSKLLAFGQSRGFDFDSMYKVIDEVVNQKPY